MWHMYLKLSIVQHISFLLNRTQLNADSHKKKKKKKIRGNNT